MKHTNQFIPKVLIVDDTPAYIKILGEELKTEYKVVFTTNGEDALKMAMSKHPPQLILLDIMMPGIDGFEVCRRLKSDRSTHHIPVIFLTAKEDDIDKAKGFDCGAADYIIKPFNLIKVKSIVKTHMELIQCRDKLTNLSSFDKLTGLPNRRGFDHAIEQEWLSARDRKRSLSLTISDIDFFKEFNQYYGPAAGDDCLKRIGKVLKNTVRIPFDFIARYGGEEFAAIHPGMNSTTAAYMAEIMRRKVESLNICHAHSLVTDRITISLGISTIIPSSNFSSDVIIDAAEQVLNQAKKAGRNQIKSIDLK